MTTRNPIKSAGFDFDAVDRALSGGGDETGDLDAMAQIETLSHGILVVLRDGHVDAIKQRAAALARLLGLFASDAEAAREIGVHRSTITRAVARMQSELQTAARNTKKVYSPMKPSHS